MRVCQHSLVMWSLTVVLSLCQWKIFPSRKLREICNVVDLECCKEEYCLFVYSIG